jgi:hypothetical protein
MFDDEGRHGRKREPGVHVSRCEIPARLLKRGMNFVTVTSDISMVRVSFHPENVVSFSADVIEGIFEDNRQGVVAPSVLLGLPQRSPGTLRRSPTLRVKCDATGTVRTDSPYDMTASHVIAANA